MNFLTGPRQSGKTGLVLELAENAVKRGLRVAGFASPGLWEHGQRSGFDLLEFDTGEKYPLSRRVKGLRPIPYMFDAESLAKGSRALSIPRCRAADLVIVDEVGPIELRGGGWAHCLESLLALDGPVHLWVVRTSLFKPVQAHFGLRATVFTVAEGQMMANRLIGKIVNKRHG